MNIDKLKAMSRDDLVKLAVSQGVQRIHHKAKPETIIKQIIEAVSAKPVQPMQVSDHPATLPKAALFHTKEEFEMALAPLKARIPQLESIYTEGPEENERLITLRCKGAEECFNMSVGLRWFMVRAKAIAQGRMALMGHQDFGSINPNGKNAYTDTVLA